MSPKSYGLGDFVLVCIILTANLYVLARYLNIQSLQLIWPIYPLSNVSNQGHRVGSSGLKGRKFLTNPLMGLFFQCFGICVTWKCMNHYHIHSMIYRCLPNKNNLPLSISHLLKRYKKETFPIINLCAASPVESVGVLHVRQLKDRHSKKSNLKMPHESFKLHFPVHAMG